MSTSAGARACYDALRARGIDHEPALRQLANRLVGILHGCLKTKTCHEEAKAWGHHAKAPDQAPPESLPPGKTSARPRPRGAKAGKPAAGALPQAC